MTWADFVVRGTLVLAAGFAAAFASGRASAALRHLIWTAAFGALLVLPVVLQLAPKVAVATWASEKEPLPHGRGSDRGVLATHGVDRAGGDQRSSEGRDSDGRGAEWLFVYLAGLLIVAGRFLAGAVKTGRMVRQARPAAYAQALADRLCRDLAIGRPVRALESSSAAVPMTWGTLRPVVLLPEAAGGWPAARLHAVVLHELVHVQRHDLVAQVAAQAACCLYWFHPMVWPAVRQLRKERETACDDAVLSGGVAASDYAGHLLELARGMVQRRSLADAPAMAENGDLEQRVRAVLDRGRNRAPVNRRLATAVAALACLLVLPVALVTLHAQAGSGGLAGVVQDPSGARVPNCEVRIRNLDHKNEEVGNVNAAGEFGFANVPAGRYAIEVRARGFAPGKTESLVVGGQQNAVVVALTLGQISEAVKVRGAKPANGSMTPRTQEAIPSGRAPQRIPVGGNVQPAKLLSQVPPVYPANLKQQGIAGTVMLRAIISKTGEPLNPVVINTTVHPGLAQAALDAVRQWRYQPTLLNGQPVEIVTNIDVTFELDQ
jgi:TonB family protein